MIRFVTLVASSIGTWDVTSVPCSNVVCFFVEVVEFDVVSADPVVIGRHDKWLVGIFLL